VFNNGPSPASFTVLEASGGTWTPSDVLVAEGKVEVQLGIRNSNGQAVVRKLDSQKAPLTGPLVFQTGDPNTDGWSLVEAKDFGDEDVTWTTKKSGEPKTKTYELKGGNVFHKAMWFEPQGSAPGILTISANVPALQLWRESKPGKGDWSATTLWTAAVGGREHRMRDVESGDVDGDGEDELVVVTHDLGAIFVLENEGGTWNATEIHRTEERTFVHEVEIGDVDGDGKLEFFTTPSEPNRFDGHEQAGGIDMFQWDGSSYQRTEVAHLTERHAKEILVVDYDNDGKSELYAALEAEGMEDESAVVLLRQWTWSEGGLKESANIDLDGEMCRFLNLGDTNGDGVNELIASTRGAGIFSAHFEDGAWVSKKIVPGYLSGGFEHATVVFDWDGDGRDELFVGSDKQKKIRRFYLEEGKSSFSREDIADFSDDTYFVWNIMPLPVRK